MMSATRRETDARQDAAASRIARTAVRIGQAESRADVLRMVLGFLVVMAFLMYAGSSHGAVAAPAIASSSSATSGPVGDGAPPA